MSLRHAWFGLITLGAFGFTLPNIIAADDGLPNLAAKIAPGVSRILSNQPSSTQPTFVVMRPLASSDPDKEVIVEAIRRAVLESVQTEYPNASVGSQIERFFRQLNVLAMPSQEQLQRVEGKFGSPNIVYVQYFKKGTHRSVALSFFAKDRILNHALVDLDRLALPTPTESLLGFDDRGHSKQAIEDCLEDLADDLRAAGARSEVDRFNVRIRALASSHSQEVFDQDLFEAIKHVFQSFQPDEIPDAIGGEGRAATKDGKEVPVLDVSYAKRMGQLAVSLRLLTSTSEIWHGTSYIDLCDLAEIPEVPAVNLAVLQFAKVSIGKTIGNGECWTLAAEALSASEAQGANGYTFGRKLAKDESVLPGDIIQFTSARFEGPGWWLQLGSPNHTAIVEEVLSDTACSILEQHPGPVTEATIDFKNLKSGSFEFWRPQPKN
jgi:hypothetical protein